MLTCPHCESDIVLRELKHQGMWKNYRVCPGCKGRFTVDPGTRRRQAAFVFIALLALLLTGLLYFQGKDWLLPTLTVDFILVALVFWANRLVSLVPVNDKSPHDL